MRPNCCGVHLADPEPRVAVAAATALARSPARAGQSRGRGHPEEARGRHARRWRARRDGRWRRRSATSPSPRFRRLLVPLLYDNHAEVVRDAIRSARAHGGVGRLVPARPDFAARPSRAQGRGAGRARRVRGGDRPGAGARRERSARARLDSPPHPRHAGADAHAGVDGRAGGMSRGSRRFPEVQGDRGDRTAPPRLSRHRVSTGAHRDAGRAATRRSTTTTSRCSTTCRDTTPAADRCSTVRSTTSSTRTLDRIYRLVGLLYNMDDVAAARYTIERAEGHAPGRGRRVPRQPAGRRRSQTGAADSRGHSDRRKGAVTRTWS